jgi:flavodoxin
MKKALIVYHSISGNTEKFAKEIGKFCSQNDIEIKIASISDFTNDDLIDVDYVFLGCWTHGLMILFQHPDKYWVEFAQSLPELNGKKIVLFTTYKIATGSMFNKMKKWLKCNSSDIILKLKSRSAKLDEGNINLLNKIFLN